MVETIEIRFRNRFFEEVPGHGEKQRDLLLYTKIKDGYKVYNYHMNYNFIKSIYHFIYSINYLKNNYGNY